MPPRTREKRAQGDFHDVTSPNTTLPRAVQPASDQRPSTCRAMTMRWTWLVPLIDLRDLGVAHHPLDREVLDISGPTQQLDRVRRHLHRDIGGEALRRRPKNDRSRSPRSDFAAATYTSCRAASSSIAMSASMNCNPLKLRDRLPELLALLDIGDRDVERPLRHPDRLGADRDPVWSRVFSAILVPRRVPRSSVRRDRAVVEEQFPRRRSLDPEFALLLTEGEPGSDFSTTNADTLAPRRPPGRSPP